MKLINGKELSNLIYLDLKNTISTFSVKPRLGIILANDDEASRRYVRIKQEKALELGIDVDLREFNVTKGNALQFKDEILNTINEFNSNNSLNGYLVQLPLHEDIQEFNDQIIESIDSRKDVDGLTSITLGKISHNDSTGFIPATVEGILECINQTMNNRVDWLNSNLDSELAGKDIVIINNSNLIGKPLSNILMSKSATVSILNKHTKDIKQFTEKADIVITATGKGQFLDHTYFKNNATVIDITSKKIGDKISGDVILSKELEEKIEWLTPVPGGVGPLTVAFLMKNLVKAYRLQN